MQKKTIGMDIWGFWKTGKVDHTLFTMLKDSMIFTKGKGWLVIILLTMIISIVRHQRRKKNNEVDFNSWDFKLIEKK